MVEIELAEACIRLRAEIEALRVANDQLITTIQRTAFARGRALAEISANSGQQIDALRARVERYEDALRAVLFQILSRHPAPWHVEQDWTYEVITQDGLCVAKCSTPEGAGLIAVMAQAIETDAAEDAETILARAALENK